MTGHIVRFDHFGNAISNIPFTAFKEFVGDASFRITVGGLAFDKVSASYFQTNYVCLVGSSGYLEFGRFSGSLKEDKDISVGDAVSVARSSC
jgi:S-adenosylmethionine hydrolase